MSRPRILFVAPVEPWCRENGSSLITADLLEALASLDGVEIFPVFARRPPPGYERRPAEGLEGVLLDIPGLPRWLSVLKAATRGAFPLRHRFDNRRVATAVREVVERSGFEPDLVHVEHLPLVDIGVMLSRRFGCPLVYRAHNIESKLWARRLGLPGPLRAPIVTQIERSEADAVGATDLTLCISQVDLDWARSVAPRTRSELLPCTLDVGRYASIGRDDRVFDAQICFVGGLDWAPNEDGLRWFVDQVLPEVVARVPDAGLAVLARGATERPWLSDHPSVRILPAEAEAGRLFASSHVSIAPLFQGGGVRIKIPESLAVECPVVATLVGAEGHDLPGLTRTDDPAEFAAACVRHLSRGARDEPRADLHTGVQARYGASVQAERLAAMWSEAIDARHAPARAE